MIFLLFREKSGWFWRLKTSSKHEAKIIAEDILKMLYHSENQGKRIDFQWTFDQISYRNSSILKVIEKMVEEEFIFLKNQQLKLTNSGRDYALKVIRAHRLYEKFLAEKTGFDKKDWHNLAEKQEHLLTDEDIEFLNKELKNPLFDPHGDPIPNAEGQISETQGKIITDWEIGEKGKITHIKDEPAIFYQELVKQKIHIGSIVQILEKSSKDITIYSEGEQITLSITAASQLTMQDLEAEEETDFQRLSYLNEDEKAEIMGISKECRGEVRRRLLDLGFVKGSIISIQLGLKLWQL